VRCRVYPVMQPEMTKLCRRVYPGHPRGCPNYGIKPGCPPTAPMYDSVYNLRDLERPVIAIINWFDLTQHVARMRERHPDWSERQLYCCLYWQKGARRDLKREVDEFLETRPAYRAEFTPEAMGVNVTATLKAAGIVLEWPPRKRAAQVALAGIPLDRKKVRHL